MKLEFADTTSIDNRNNGGCKNNPSLIYHEGSWAMILKLQQDASTPTEMCVVLDIHKPPRQLQLQNNHKQTNRIKSKADKALPLYCQQVQYGIRAPKFKSYSSAPRSKTTNPTKCTVFAMLSHQSIHPSIPPPLLPARAQNGFHSYKKDKLRKSSLLERGSAPVI